MSIYDFRRGPDWYGWLGARIAPFALGRVLDVGAGIGRLWQSPIRPTQLVLSDAFTPMCELLRNVGASVVQARAEALPLADDAFDLAIASHVLYHLDDPLIGVCELLRVVRPGGWVAITTNTVEHFHQLSRIAEEAGLAPLGARTHLRFDDAAVIAALQPLAHEIICHRYTADLSIPTAEPVVAYLTSTLDDVDDQVEEAVRRSLSDVINRDGAFELHSSATVHLALVG